MSLKSFPSFLQYFSEAEMNGISTSFYTFKSFRLAIDERQLFKNDIPIPLTTKAFDVIAFLVEREGHLVLKEELIEAIWPDSFVDEASVARIIHTLRKVLGDDQNGNKFIETVAKKGYRFIAEVVATDNNAAASAARRYRPRAVFIIGMFLTISFVGVGLWYAVGPLSARNGSRANPSQPNSGEAYQLYLDGRRLLERKYDNDIADALSTFEKAIRLEPNFADAWAGKADAKFQIFLGSKQHDDIGQVRTAINRALELDPASSYAHTLSCRLLNTYDWDFAGAEKECRLAVELDPRSHEGHAELALLLSALSREDEALQHIDAAVALAPSSLNKRFRGMILYYSRRYDEAIAQLSQMEETDPGFNESRSFLMSCYIMKQDYPRALEARLRQMQKTGASPEELTAMRATYEQDGWPGVLKTMVDPTSPYGKGGTAVYVALGDTDKAFESLDKAIERRAIMVIHTAREPRLDPIRNDPRFEAILRRIGLK